MRTAVGLGALAANRTRVTGFLKDAHGAVTGAAVTDLATGATHEIRARRTINATGVWTEATQDLAADAGGLRVLTSKGMAVGAVSRSVSYRLDTTASALGWTTILEP